VSAGPGQPPAEADLAARIDTAYDIIFARELDTAEALLSEAETHASAAGYSRQRIRAIYWLAYIASLRGEHFLGEQLLAEALRLAEAEHSDALVAGIHFSLARVHMMRGRLSDAEDALGLALMHANNSQDVRRQADAYGLQGTCRRSLGLLEDAYEYINTSAALWRSIPMEEIALIETLLDLHVVAFELGEDAAAQAAFDEAEALPASHLHERLLARGYLQLAVQNLVLGQFGSAESFLARAEQMKGNLLDYESRLEFELVRGKYELAAGNARAAGLHFEEAKRLAQNTQSRFRLAEVRLEHARALIKLGELGHALALLLDIEVAFEMFGAQTLLAQTYCLWTRYYIAEKRPEAALAAMARARKIADALRPHAGRTLEADLRKAEAALETLG
jgi:tetratricopeptide (TPR) repeat protein